MTNWINTSAFKTPHNKSHGVESDTQTNNFFSIHIVRFVLNNNLTIGDDCEESGLDSVLYRVRFRSLNSVPLTWAHKLRIAIIYLYCYIVSSEYRVIYYSLFTSGCIYSHQVFWSWFSPGTDTSSSWARQPCKEWTWHGLART